MFIAEAGISNDTPPGVKKIAEQAAEEARAVPQFQVLNESSFPNFKTLAESSDKINYGPLQSGEQSLVGPLMGPDLELWDVQAHQYRTETGGSVNLLARLFCKALYRKLNVIESSNPKMATKWK